MRVIGRESERLARTSSHEKPVIVLLATFNQTLQLPIDKMMPAVDYFQLRWSKWPISYRIYFLPIFGIN